MPIIKLIDRTTDISRLKMRQMDWDTEAEANRKIAESLTPELIEKQKIDKWNGEVPKIQGSNTSTIVDTRDMTADENAE